MSLPVAPVTVIPAASIEEALRSGRQYLAGDLARPQALAHVHDAHIEMGISYYL